MSEQGWRDFLAAEGVDDWVVLHGGATAVFRVGSLRAAARLAEAIADAQGVAGAGVLLTLADDRITVRLTRDLWSLEAEHIAARLEAALAAGGRVVDASNAPRWWTLSDRAGNRVCVCGWPDGSPPPQ